MTNRQVRMLQDSDGGVLKKGDVTYIAQKAAEHYVAHGIAEYVKNGQELTVLNPEQKILIQRLTEAGLSTRRFLKVDDTKRAFEKDWQNRLYTPEELKDYPRWGICGKDNLVLCDTDKPEMIQFFRDNLPPTLTAQSPRRQLPHFYYNVVGGDVPNKTLYIPGDYDEKGRPIGAGEIRANNQYLVAPGTTIKYNDLKTGEPKTGVYKIVEDAPIATVNFEKFMEVITPYLGKDSSQRLTTDQITKGVSEGERHNVGIKMANYLVGVQNFDYETTLIEMLRWNKICTPPNNDEEIKQIVLDAVNYQKSIPKTKTPYLNMGVKNKVNPVLLAKALMADYIFVVDAETNELFYYDETEKVYSNKTEQPIKREIADRIDEEFKTRYYNEVSEFITATSKLVKMDGQNPELLAVKNGILNVLTRELRSFSPAFYITNKLNVEYNPEMKYEESENKIFLEAVIPKATQRKQTQELIGHTLYRKIVTETSLVALGKGGNGKSIFLSTIKSMLGAKNVCSHTIQQLCYDKFKIAELKGKLANLCADLPQKEIGNTGTYKALVSGDSVPISIKHVQGKGDTIDPYTKFLYSANSLPPIKNEEDCYAWYRRFIFADFNRTFTPENSTPRQELLDKLSTPKEKSALLNWALEGLARLIKNGDVSDKPEVESIRKEYRKRSSTTLAYFDDVVTVTDSPDDWVFTEDWVRDYVTYCHNRELKPKTRGEFVSDVEQHLSGVKKARIRPAAKSNPLSAWRYVKLVSDVLDVSGSVPLCPGLNHIWNKVLERDTTDTLDTESTNNKIKEVSESATSATTATIGEFNVDSCFPSGQFPVCFSCHKPIVQLESLTNIDGRPIHKSCKAEIEAQKRNDWRCPELLALVGRPFCNRIQSFLAKPEDCSADCSLLKEEPS